MPRTPKYSSDEARTLILDSARKVFARRGFQEASMDEIAAGSDAGKPLVYRYFSNKSALYSAVVEDCIRQHAQPLLASIRDHDDVPAMVRRTMDLYMDLILDHPDDYQLLFRTDTLRPPEVQQRLFDLYEEFEADMGAILAEETVVPGKVRNMLLADLIFTSIHAGARRIAASSDPEARRTMTDLLYAWGQNAVNLVPAGVLESDRAARED